MSKEFLRIQYRNALLDHKLTCNERTLDELARIIWFATVVHGNVFADELMEMNHEYGF